MRDHAPIKSKLQHPSPQGNLGHLTIFCARGVGNLTGKAFSGGREFDLCLGGVGKIEPLVSGVFFRAPKSLGAVAHKGHAVS